MKFSTVLIVVLLLASVVKAADTDNDGFDDSEDFCDNEWGNSTHDGIVGCPDNDGDGHANIADRFPNDSSEYADDDDDHVGNNKDDCPNRWGNSTWPLNGCLDSDGDGVADQFDDFDYNASETNDTDGDGFGDNSDPCIEVHGILDGCNDPPPPPPSTNNTTNETPPDNSTIAGNGTANGTENATRGNGSLVLSPKSWGLLLGTMSLVAVTVLTRTPYLAWKAKRKQAKRDRHPIQIDNPSMHLSVDELFKTEHPELNLHIEDDLPEMD